MFFNFCSCFCRPCCRCRRCCECDGIGEDAGGIVTVSGRRDGRSDRCDCRDGRSERCGCQDGVESLGFREGCENRGRGDDSGRRGCGCN
ncbi:MAG: hypothetical protein FWE62_04135 [Firmicutes bacterium]|nr:hypothetical protein [Bacillota bacterium]